MKIFLDTEFIHGYRKPMFGQATCFLELISIGLVAENGRDYYAVSNEFKPAHADEWVKANVLPNIPLRNYEDKNEWKKIVKQYGKSNSEIAREIKNFTYIMQECDNEPIQFYGYFADYDWVLFGSLFGGMLKMPGYYPQYCRDLKQMLDEKIETLNMSYRETFIGSAPDVSDDILNRPATLEEKLRYVKCRADYPRQEREHNALGDARWNIKLNDFIKNLK